MNIFVTKLGLNVTSKDLNVLFSAYGDVDSATIVVDRETGKSKGFGYVEMPETSEALDAIDAIDGRQLKGKTIAVKVADKKGEGRSASRFETDDLEDLDGLPDRKVVRKSDRKKPTKLRNDYDL